MTRKPDPAICLHTRRVVRWQADGTPLTVCEHCGAVLLYNDQRLAHILNNRGSCLHV